MPKRKRSNSEGDVPKKYDARQSSLYKLVEDYDKLCREIEQYHAKKLTLSRKKLKNDGL